MKEKLASGIMNAEEKFFAFTGVSLRFGAEGAFRFGTWAKCMQGTVTLIYFVLSAEMQKAAGQSLLHSRPICLIPGS